jgi:hypothetical protein
VGFFLANGQNLVYDISGTIDIEVIAWIEVMSYDVKGWNKKPY